MSAYEWRSIGPHRFARDADTLRWSPDGEITVEQGAEIIAHVVELARAHGYVLVLIDGRNSPPLRYEVRRLYVDNVHRHKVRLAVAVYGGLPASRIVATLAFRAARLLTDMDIEIRYTATEQEAVAFLSSQRSRFLSRR
jgi:hypothetical protein